MAHLYTILVSILIALGLMGSSSSFSESELNQMRVQNQQMVDNYVSTMEIHNDLEWD